MANDERGPGQAAPIETLVQQTTTCARDYRGIRTVVKLAGGSRVAVTFVPAAQI
jgi:hypothetical protein